MRKILSEVLIIFAVFFIAFTLKKAVAKDMLPLYGCIGDVAAHKSSKLINCSSLDLVVTSLRKQMDFTIESKLGWEIELACRMPYAYAVRASVEDQPALIQKAPELFSQCNKALTNFRR